MPGRLLLAAALAALLAPAAASARPLQTGLVDPEAFAGEDQALAFQRAAAAGTSSVRLFLDWRSVAPAPRTPSFRAADHTDPGYSWTAFDRQVTLARERALEPTVVIMGTPAWAGRGATARTATPDPAQLRLFARAAATRYSGGVAGLPRVRHWQVWNEPNLEIFLAPQRSGQRTVSPGAYRQMVNAVAGAVRAVRRDNLVIAGGLAPYASVSGPNVPPLRFMREFLCLSAGASPRPTCSARAAFDIWSTHPYSWGGPRYRAFSPDDVSIGDLPQMRRLLDAAGRHRKIATTRQVAFWVTEFGWDTSPPDPRAAPIPLQTRWTAEALYEMWKAGVTSVTWFLLRDEPYPQQAFQTGLYFRGAGGLRTDRPKPTLRAFRFPFVAYREPGAVRVWTRTPGGRPAIVIFEQRTSSGWRRLASVRTSRYGIVHRRLTSAAASGNLRVRLASGGDFSHEFSLTRPPDRRIPPFG